MQIDSPKPTDALSGELWDMKERIRKASICGKLPGWDLCSGIKLLATPLIGFYKLRLLARTSSSATYFSLLWYVTFILNCRKCGHVVNLI
ncbi:hypothetical protein Dimus_012064 [Dionaea muscipula]